MYLLSFVLVLVCGLDLGQNFPFKQHKKTLKNVPKPCAGGVVNDSKVFQIVLVGSLRSSLASTQSAVIITHEWWSQTELCLDIIISTMDTGGNKPLPLCDASPFVLQTPQGILRSILRGLQTNRSSGKNTSAKLEIGYPTLSGHIISSAKCASESRCQRECLFGWERRASLLEDGRKTGWQWCTACG